MLGVRDEVAFCASFPAAARPSTDTARCALLPTRQSVSLSPSKFIQGQSNVRRDRRSTMRIVRAKKIHRAPTCMFPGNIEDIPIEAVPWDDPKSVPSHWNRPGVYGVYSSDGTLQFVASTADVGKSMSGHKQVIKVPQLVYSVRMITVDSIADAPLDSFAEAWIMSYYEAQLPIPPGNTDEMPQWRDKPISPDVYFTGAIEAPTAEEKAKLEIENILANHKYVLFMKGTSYQPRCGFSNSVLEIMSTHLDKDAGEFVCVDCLDAERNAGLRETIKSYSSWPTIPQLYVNGDFVGGADIVSEMNANGELSAMLIS